MNRVITEPTEKPTTTPALDIPAGQAFYGRVPGYDFKLWLKLPTGPETTDFLIFPLDNPNSIASHSVFASVGHTVTGRRLQVEGYTPVNLDITVAG